jgi:pyruvate ferredoxin oxidoreductase beta subunit
MQGRFRNITPELIEEIKRYVDENWKWIEKMASG